METVLSGDAEPAVQSGGVGGVAGGGGGPGPQPPQGQGLLRSSQAVPSPVSCGKFNKKCCKFYTKK